MLQKEKLENSQIIKSDYRVKAIDLRDLKRFVVWSSGKPQSFDWVYIDVSMMK